MRAPLNLQILAISSGLTESEVVALWQQARAQSLTSTGSKHPRYDRQTRNIMARLIENKATADVPFNLVPWVMFDLHLGLALVRARIALQSLAAHTRELVGQLRSKQTV
ncbi:MAG: hypothetical protein K2Y25_07225 [Pseudomonadaceae bacterium]|jgi:hypothetical protein|nr:hypothetical protein [Pseudomonadaceae bacterium]